MILSFSTLCQIL